MERRMLERSFEDMYQSHTSTIGVEEMIRVVVVDRHEAMREGLRQMIHDNDTIKVVGVAKNEGEALEKIQKLSPDIVILDSKLMGDNNNIINSIKRYSPNAGIIMLNDEPDHLVPAIKNGVSAFLAKNISHDELTLTIRIIHLWHALLFQNEDNFALVKL
jgi:DNA-binding NarL/FixJ family response regulator